MSRIGWLKCWLCASVYTLQTVKKCWEELLNKFMWSLSRRKEGIVRRKPLTVVCFVCECQSAVFEFQFSSFFHSPKCQISYFFARLLSSQYFFLACRALNPPWCIKAAQGDESIEEGERQCRQNVDWIVCLSDLWMPDLGHQSMQQCSQCCLFQTADTCSSSGGKERISVSIMDIIT